MLIETREGFDFTGADCAGWLKEAGFSEARLEPLVGPGLDGDWHQVRDLWRLQATAASFPRDCLRDHNALI